MKKALSILTIVLFLFSCTEKEKTYEELEAEVLCDVLPEIAKYELENYFWYYRLESLQIDSTKIEDKKYLKKIRDEKISNIISLLNEYKKVEIGVLDTLYTANKIKEDKNNYKFDSLGVRGLDIKEFEKCNLKVHLVNYKNTFEGDERNSETPLLFLCRVLISKNENTARFSVYKYYGGYDVICFFSKENQKWIVKEIIKE